jgi:segregation and condensation protein B
MELKAVLESLIFASDKPITIKQLKGITNTTEDDLIKNALQELEVEYRERGVQLLEISGGYQFRTHPDTAVWVKKLLIGRPPRLTQAMLENLSIIAYRQPITRPEIEDIRGVDCGGVIRLLLERGLIRIVGKKEEVGRPLLYGTTKQFLEFFNLRDLKELPTLKEFTELTQEHAEQISEQYGSEEAAGEAQEEQVSIAQEDSANRDIDGVSIDGASGGENAPVSATGSSNGPGLHLVAPISDDLLAATTSNTDNVSSATITSEVDTTSDIDHESDAGTNPTERIPSDIKTVKPIPPEDEDDGALSAIDRAIEEVDHIIHTHQTAEQVRLKEAMESILGPMPDTSSTTIHPNPPVNSVNNAKANAKEPNAKEPNAKEPNAKEPNASPPPENHPIAE